MLRTLIDRPISVAITTLALVMIGFFSLLRLPVSLLPTLERPRLVVVARDLDRSREELVQQVVEPLERRFLSLPGVLEVRSRVDDGACSLTLETEWQTDVDTLRIDAERRLAVVSGLGLDELLVRIDAGDPEPIVEIAVLGSPSAYDRTVFADKVLIPELGRLEGAGRILRLGGVSRRPVVRPDAAALVAAGLTAQDLVERLSQIGHSRPLGLLRDGGRIRPALVREEVRSVEELRRVRVAATSPPGTSPPGSGGVGEEASPGVALGDLAEIRVEELTDGSLFRLDGEPGAVVQLHRAPGANAVWLARLARQHIASLGDRASRNGLRVEVIRDASLEVWQALRQLALAGGLGLLLGALVLRLMLGSFGPTLALVVVVPASIVIAFGGFYLWHVSLDVVSLAGLALAAGMLVDNSIVVLEAIASARERGRDVEDEASEAVQDPVLVGTRQIALALVASFSTTAVVFLPLVYLRGLARAFFGVQAFAIVTTLAISLALSLTLTPVLARWIGKASSVRASRARSPGLGLYLRFLDTALARPGRVVGVTLVLLAAGLVAGLDLDRELMPGGPSRGLLLDFRLPAGTAIDTARERILSLEQAAATVGGTPTRTTVLYRGEEAEGLEIGEPGERGALRLDFADAGELARSSPALAAEWARQPGVIGRSAPRRSAIAAAVERGSGRLGLEASASTPARARQLAERVAKSLATSLAPGARLAGEAGAMPRPAWVLEWNHQRLARLETDVAGLTGQVTSGLGGFPVGRMTASGIDQEIWVEATRPLDVGLLPVRPAPGWQGNERSRRVLPLRAVARIERQMLPRPFERHNGRPSVALEIDGFSDPARISELLGRFPLAADEGLRLTGQAWEMRRSFGQLRLALGLALVLVFLTVAALYESFTVPLVVMTTVPVAAAGALLALAAAGQSLNVMSFLGLVVLAGIVVNNAIVLVHRFRQLAASGRPLALVIREAAGERYRPILMTTATTFLGMVPLALLGGEGVELRRALAVAVCGGLLTSMFAALLLVPVLARRLAGRRS